MPFLTFVIRSLVSLLWVIRIVPSSNTPSGFAPFNGKRENSIFARPGTSTHAIAAAFALGREDLIPDMFRALVLDLERCFPGQWDLMRRYLERHIHLDEEHHLPLALEMLAVLCGDDQEKWREATFLYCSP